MNEFSLNDPLLQSLEARLASAVPAVSTEDQQRLLYECAFAAGRKTGVQSVRHYQLLAITLAFTVVAVSVTRFNPQPVIPQPQVQPESIAVVPDPIRPAAPAPPDSGPSGRLAATIPLDAWQLSAADEAAKSQSLVQLDEPSQDALTVKALTRQFLQ